MKLNCVEFRITQQNIHLWRMIFSTVYCCCSDLDKNRRGSVPSLALWSHSWRLFKSWSWCTESFTMETFTTFRLTGWRGWVTVIHFVPYSINIAISRLKQRWTPYWRWWRSTWRESLTPPGTTNNWSPHFLNVSTSTPVTVSLPMISAICSVIWLR